MSKQYTQVPNEISGLFAFLAVSALAAWIIMLSFGGIDISVGFLPVWGFITGGRLTYFLVTGR